MLFLFSLRRFWGRDEMEFAKYSQLTVIRRVRYNEEIYILSDS